MGAPSTKRFAIRRRLGEGAMGVVYEAFDEERRASVALKTLNRFDAGALARFKREFRALQGMVHPNLVALDELFFENDEWFFTMELLDGVDFVSHVTGSPARVAFQSTIRESAGKVAARAPFGAGDLRPIASFHEQKLRDALRQLLEGVAALHAVDKVHRDIKPSNVLVTREGRVVLLDFGLVVEASSDDRSTGGGVVGTPAYMAPEQAASRDIGPAADLYAVGAMLYEALTGRIPIDGSPLEMLLEKQKREALPPASIAAGIPEDLSALCAKMLRFDPALRPSAAEVLRTLSVRRAPGAAPHRVSTEMPIFVGRGAELDELRAAFEASAAGELATTLVCGESGIGKSYLVRRFTAQLLADHPDAILLEGRCYERETVPYKTLDGIVDALSRRLSRMSATDVGTLLPTRSATLAQVFPVMLRIPQVAKAHAALSLTVEPHELRQRAFVALRELFTRLAVRRPTILVIDDLQWADDDGLRALAEILRPPEAPPLLLLGTVRAASGGKDAGLRRVHAVIPGEPRVIDLATLGPSDARELAVAVLRRSDVSDADPEVIASEAGGHPLFVEELARHVALGGSARDDVKLDDAIWSRIVQLEGPTREMAELVVIAGKPIPQEVVAAAARIEPAEFNRRAATLRVSNLARTGGARWADAIEPYHDRVREAVLAQLEPERRRALHEALAIAFEASSHHDPETLATHWREAGNASRAARYATAAGDQASSKFAFDRAAQWYEQALSLLPEGHASHRELRVKLGDALSFAGRGALAAGEYEAAAASAPPLEALDLRRRAADQLLRSGHFDRGIDASRAVLAMIGMRLPSTRFGTIATLLWYRCLLAIRGLRFREREKGRIKPDELMRIDACWSMSVPLGFADHFLGVVLGTRGLLLALAAGDLERIARSLVVETTLSSTAGGPAWRRTERRLRLGRELTERSGAPLARFFFEAGSGIAQYCNGRYHIAVEHLRAVLDMREEGTGYIYEQVAARNYAIVSLALLGRFGELRRLQDEGLRGATARGDVFAAVNFRIGYSALRWLVEDRPDVADENARAALEQWSKKGFHIEHHYALFARVLVRAYVGDVEAAHALACEVKERTIRSLLWRVQGMRIRTLHLCAMSALAMLRRGLGDRRVLLRTIDRNARAIERERMPWSDPLAAVVRAGVALYSGARAAAIAGLGAAIREFDANHMAAYAAATRDRVARLRNDASTASDLEAAEAYFRAEEVVAPERFMTMLVPGLLERDA